MVQIRIPDAYSYFYDLAKIIINNEKLPVDEINLVGGRKSAKTTTVELFLAILALSGVTNVGMISLRNQVQDSDELLNDFINTFDAYELDYSIKSHKKIISIGNTQIRVAGVNSQNKTNKAKKSGLSKFGNVDYIIIFFEERFEFEEKDVLAIKEAVRSINPDKTDIQYLIINACNPWAKSSPYISYCGKYQTWDINKLKTTGSQIGQYEIQLGEGQVKRALFHYTNWRVAKQFLSQGDINSILDIWNQDKRRASTSDYGLPGYEEGAIYTHLLNNIGNAIYQEHQFLTGGMDYGWGRDSSNGKTACHFMGYTPGNGIDVYGEYVTDNHTIVKSPNKVAEEICEFYLVQMREYCNRNGWASAFNIKVRVDNMAVGMIQILNNTAQKYKLNWLKFIPCRKYQVQDRIEVVCSTMYQHKLRLAPSVKLLKGEMELAHYEESATQKRAKVNDHSLNAFEYGIEEFFWQLVKDNGITKIAHKKEKIW